MSWKCWKGGNCWLKRQPHITLMSASSFILPYYTRFTCPFRFSYCDWDHATNVSTISCNHLLHEIESWYEWYPGRGRIWEVWAVSPQAGLRIGDLATTIIWSGLLPRSLRTFSSLEPQCAGTLRCRLTLKLTTYGYNSKDGANNRRVKDYTACSSSNRTLSGTYHYHGIVLAPCRTLRNNDMPSERNTSALLALKAHLHNAEGLKRPLKDQADKHTVKMTPSI